MYNSEHSFTLHLKKWRKPLLNYIYNITPYKSSAEDILQRAVIIMWRKFDSFNEGTDFMKWASTIAYNENRNYSKITQRCPIVFNTVYYEDSVQSLFSEENVSDEKMEKLKKIITLLNKEEKYLVECIYIQGMSIKDLANRDKKPVQTYYNKINLLKKKLSNISIIS